MKALILAAGQGKRLLPFTEILPKCLLKVADRPIIDYQIDNLRASGVTDIVFVVGYKAELIQNHMTTYHSDLNVSYILNNIYKSTYPAYGLWLAKENLLEDCLYLNADVICHPQIIERVVKSKIDSLTAIQETPWDEEEVNVIIDKTTNSILEMGKHVSKELSDGEFIGVTKISPTFGKTLIEVLDHFVSKEEYKKFAADALNLTIQRGLPMQALNVSDLPAIEIDTPEDLENAHKKITEIFT